MYLCQDGPFQVPRNCIFDISPVFYSYWNEQTPTFYLQKLSSYITCHFNTSSYRPAMQIDGGLILQVQMITVERALLISSLINKLIRSTDNSTFLQLCPK